MELMSFMQDSSMRGKISHVNRLCDVFPHKVLNFVTPMPEPSPPTPMPAPPEPSPTLRGAAPGGPSPALVRALRKLLRPLVRLMLSHGITYTYLADLLKGLFVEVAERDFRLDDKPPTDSRVSLVSGVHRKDVARLRGLLDSAEPIEPSVVPRGAQLVAHWMGNPRYLLEDGSPRPLARLVSEGGDLSFEALVSSVNSDIRSRVVLDEWLSLGVVHLDDAGRVCLNTAAFVPSRGADEKAFYLGHNLHDHAAAAVHNMLAGQPPFMERSVHYNALTPDSVQRLNRMSEQLGMKALLAINKAAMDAEAQDKATADQAGQPEPDQRFTFGIYFFSERHEDPPAPAGRAGPEDA
jgi:Family of unknown function (DUF6502)